MPKVKEGRRRHGAWKNSPKAKKASPHTGTTSLQEKIDGNQTKSGGHSPGQVASSLGVQASFAVSANWKNLAKQLGLDSSRSRRERTTDCDKSKVRVSKVNSKSISYGKRKKTVLEAPQPKRRKLDVDDAVAGKVVDGVPHVPQRESTCKLITGNDISASRCVSLDCEMVGTGSSGDFSMLARCSIVNHHGNVLYDSYVAPMDKITDYRTKFSGIMPKHLRGAPDFKSVQNEVSELIKGRILVGHAIHHDLKALLLSHPWRDIRDTSKFKQLRHLSKGKVPSLKKLAKEILNIDIQQDHHDSIEDACVAMRLYQLHKREWEAMVKAKRRRKGQ